MINDISKTIFFKFTNSFTKQMIAVIEMPYLPFKAANGYYSTMYKRFKKVVPFKTDSSLVVGKKWTEPQITKRTMITLNGGIAIKPKAIQI